MRARILVVEDNPNNLELMAFLLEAFGHEALLAHDGEEGLEVARRTPVDLVLLDLQMPKMDGYELVRRLRAEAGWTAPLVAVTALAMVGDREKILAAGFDGYLTKPITPETFVNDVERFLGRERSSAPAAVAAAARPEPVRPAPARLATILVVDDSAANLSLMQDTLEPFGYTLVTATTVDAALERARENRPDLILSDLHMPEKSGVDFLRAVKADARLATIPFVFLSATDWLKKQRAEVVALGAVKFIQRPIDPRALLAEIAACLERR